MFEGVVAGLLNRWLGKYVQDLDTEHLNVGIFSGQVTLQDLKLKPDALYELDLPIDVKIGSIGKINFQIPWSGLYTQPVVISVEDVLLLVGPAISNTYYDPEREKRLVRAAKRKILQELESQSEHLAGPHNFFENLFTAIVNNVQIFIRNVHIRYEDSVSSRDGPLACGLCLQSISIETTNSKWKPSLTPAGASTVYQMMRLESLSLYWNPKATVLDDEETMHITPIQYYNWKHYMLHGLDKFSMHHEDFDFVVKPLSCKVKVIINRSGEARVPRLLVDAVVQDCAVQASRAQYLSLAALARSFARINVNRKYRALRPRAPVAGSARAWWRYACDAVLVQRVRPYTWRGVRTHRDNYHRYKRAYKSTLRCPNDAELRLDLHKCEDTLPIVSIVIAREHAKFELLAEVPDRIEVREGEVDWWRPGSSDEESEPETGGGEEPERPGRAALQLCVKTDKRHSLWSHLSSPEKQRVCELIGYAEGAPRADKPKQYIEHKLNVTLANWSLMLLNRSKEVLALSVSQLLASLETRPAHHAYKVSARAESIVVEGASSEGDLVTILTADNSHSAATSTNLLALDFEKNPLSSEADYGLTCTLEPVELVYHERACTELINFLQTEPMDMEKVLGEVDARLQRAARSLLYALSRKKLFSVHVDLKGPYLLLPEHGSIQKGGNVLVLDLGRVTVKSDLQPSSLTLEDATCTELEERLYDRLHAECTSLQVLFCDSGDPWRELRKQSDSEAHLVPRVRLHLVFSNSIKKEYKLLPRYKLNVSVSSLKVNLSDRIITQLLEFAEHLPLPAPSLLPVSLLDSADFDEHCADPELAEFLQQDVIQPDPSYKQLVRLRNNIVAAYLARTQGGGSSYKAGVNSGFQQSERMFAPSEHGSEEDAELFARSVDLPGFEDNVSPHNTIDTLLRFLVGEIVVNVSRSSPDADRPYLMLRVGKLCLDTALMRYGPAVQLSVRTLLLTDKHTQRARSGEYLDILTTHDEEILNVLYRKVRADCPDFKSHFHSVEQSLVADVGAFDLNIHGEALPTLLKYLQYVHGKIEGRGVARVKHAVEARARALWERWASGPEDPPVPPGATKFSYSCRVSSVRARLRHLDSELLEARVGALESDCVFKANDRMIFKIYLNTLTVDDLSDTTLYPKLVWLEEDKVLELKYVRHAPRAYALAGDADGGGRVKSDGSLRVYLGRLHVVLLFKILQDLQQFAEGLFPGGAAGGAPAALAAGAARAAGAAWARGWHTRLTLAVELHAPTLLLPQKCSSPNLIVFSMGDLLLENFFKELSAGGGANAVDDPVVDNILVKLVNVTFSRAVMTLAGTLELQEPILEPLCVRWDLKRALPAQAASGRAGPLPHEADGLVESVTVALGQRDLATMLAVLADNYAPHSHLGSAGTCCPADRGQTDTCVKKLEAFFAQAEPIKKEATVRLCVEGAEVKLFADTEEVLSSPVREPGRALARLSAGEAWLHLDRYSDRSLELRASLQSLLLEDVRPDPGVLIRRMFQSHGGALRCADAAISVSTPPIVDATFRRSRAGDRSLHLHVEKTRLNISSPFFIALGRFVLEAMPGEKTLEGGVVNHGYVGESHGPAGAAPLHQHNNNGPRPRPPGPADPTAGCCSQGVSLSEEAAGLSVSAQFRSPEVMFFTQAGGGAGAGYALLARTELLLDYSRHAARESFTLSLAGLQVMSRLQSQLASPPAQLVLHPCDLEFSRSFRSQDEGVKVMLSVSTVDVHLAATTVHTVTEIVEEIMTELMVPEEKEPFNFATYNSSQPPEKESEDLWSPKKLVPCLRLNSAGRESDTCGPAACPCAPAAESLTALVPSVRVTLEVERGRCRFPVLVVKSTLEMSVQEWSRQLHGKAEVTLHCAAYNGELAVWEPLLEPVPHGDNTHRPWELTLSVFQAKCYPMSSRLQSEQPTSHLDSEGAERRRGRKNKPRSGRESEASGYEGDTDNEMAFIRSPHAQHARARAHAHLGLDSAAVSGAPGEDGEESEHEGGLVDKFAGGIAHLFTDDSSGSELSGGGSEASSGAEQSEPERRGQGDGERRGESEGEEEQDSGDPVSYIDTGRSRDHNNAVPLQEPVRAESVDSGLEAESLPEKLCTYCVIESRDTLNVTLTPQSARVLRDLAAAFTDKSHHLAASAANMHPLTLVNDIGPGSRVELVTRAEQTLAGRDRVLATADYDADASRPSTPGSPEHAAPDPRDPHDHWDCFEGGFSTELHTPLSTPLYSPERGAGERADPVAALYRKVTDERVHVRLQQFEQLSVVCPQRAAAKLHALQPSRNGTRYYVVLQAELQDGARRIVLRSPLQVRNETSYTLEVLYRRSELEGGVEAACAAAAAQGHATNPFEDKMRLAVVAPGDLYNVPLYIAYHCALYLLPANYERCQTASQGLWWRELAADPDAARDLLCPAKLDSDPGVFAMRVLTEPGVRASKVTRAIPNYVLRVRPPLAFHNRLPYATDISIPALGYSVRVEAGERVYAYQVDLSKRHRVCVGMRYLGLPWSGAWSLSGEAAARTLSMSADCETEGGGARLGVAVRLERADTCHLYLHAPYWLINKTGLPLQLKVSRADSVYEVTDEPLLFCGAGGGAGRAVRLRAHYSAWSKPFHLDAVGAPGLVVCTHRERKRNYRILLNVSLSELCPQLTRIVTLLPYFLVYNESRRALRFMEENEAADLWIDLPPAHALPFHPHTSSMRLHCKYRDSALLSHHFPLAAPHRTVLRMDKGSAICVEVTGGVERPFTVTFRAYAPGDAPVRIDNLCDDLFLKLHQIDSGQVALLSPYQSTLYTWDDPCKQRTLIWNIYNNKAKGFVADFAQDGFGEEKVSFHSVKQSSLTATNSVTSKLSSTLKRLTPRSSEPASSSSDDSDSCDPPDTSPRTNRTRKDKAIVYWVSYMEEQQRVFVLTQDERIAYQYRMRITSERSNYELYMALSGIGFSVCVQTSGGVKELSYVSVSDSLPQWEVNVNHKWKSLVPDLATWIEDKYHSELKCQLKDYIHIDFVKMQMTKPFFSELRRTYNPALWLQLRMSDTHTYTHLRLHRFQVDNQLPDAVFPCVLYPVPPPLSLANKTPLKPCMELVVLKQSTTEQEVYKHVKLLVQSYSVSLESGWVRRALRVANGWRVEEKPAVRLRADLALVHMPLPALALRSQPAGGAGLRVHRFQYVHISPLKLTVSLSSRGSSVAQAQSPERARGRPGERQDRPRLFNSDLLEYLFNSWSASLCDVKDVPLRMAYMELRNAQTSASVLAESTYRHYWTQLLQQFYVLILGLDILGNPYTHLADFTRALHQFFYEPHTGKCGVSQEEMSYKLAYGAAALLGHCVSGVARAGSVFAQPLADKHFHLDTAKKRRFGFTLERCGDVPAGALQASRSYALGGALALGGLLAHPTPEVYREAAALWRQRRAAGGGGGGGGAAAEAEAEATLRAALERGAAGGRPVARRRLPRHCHPHEGVRAYCAHEALGERLLGRLARGHYADTDAYLAHAALAARSKHLVLLTTQRLLMVRCGAGAGGGWRIDWAVKLEDLMEVPVLVDNKLVLHIKQNELVNYFSSDEKCIESPDAEILSWLQSKIECALILAVEDKRCPALV